MNLFLSFFTMVNPSSSTSALSSESESEFVITFLRLWSWYGGDFLDVVDGLEGGIFFFGGASFFTSFAAAICAFALAGSFLSSFWTPLNYIGDFGKIGIVNSWPSGFFTCYWGLFPANFESNFTFGSSLGGGRSRDYLTTFFYTVFCGVALSGLWSYFPPSAPFFFQESSVFLDEFTNENCYPKPKLSKF